MQQVPSLWLQGSAAWALPLTALSLLKMFPIPLVFFFCIPWEGKWISLSRFELWKNRNSKLPLELGSFLFLRKIKLGLRSVSGKRFPKHSWVSLFAPCKAWCCWTRVESHPRPPCNSCLGLTSKTRHQSQLGDSVLPVQQEGPLGPLKASFFRLSLFWLLSFVKESVWKVT